MRRLLDAAEVLATARWAVDVYPTLGRAPTELKRTGFTVGAIHDDEDGLSGQQIEDGRLS